MYVFDLQMGLVEHDSRVNCNKSVTKIGRLIELSLWLCKHLKDDFGSMSFHFSVLSPFSKKITTINYVLRYLKLKTLVNKVYSSNVCQLFQKWFYRLISSSKSDKVGLEVLAKQATFLQLGYTAVFFRKKLIFRDSIASVSSLCAVYLSSTIFIFIINLMSCDNNEL